MSGDHEWCQDVPRDEAVRAAEDAAAVPAIMHRDLPDEVALLRASVGDILGRIVRIEGEIDAGEDEARRQSAAWDGARQAYSDGLARLTAERDAARAECERLRARVAELEAASAPTANAGGAANQQEPVAWGVMSSANPPHRIGLHWDQETAHRWAAAKQDVQFKTTLVVVPLYAAPPEPRGWLTAEERACVEELLPYTFSGAQAKTLTALLARSSPPRVKVPPKHAAWWELLIARDGQWRDAIREAGGEVEE